MLQVLLVPLVLQLNLVGLVVQESPLGQGSIEAQVDPGFQVNLADPLVPAIL